jgi:hypothetical protein
MRKYQDIKIIEEKRGNPFTQGFIYGLIFGALGSFVMLSRRGTEKSTL